MDSAQQRPLQEGGDLSETRIQPRSSVMRSLSMPSSMKQYADEIRQLEDRILSEKGNLPSRTKLVRSMSNLAKQEDNVDEILSKLSHCSTEDDFILGDYGEEPFEPSHDQLANGESFLPGLQSLNEDEDTDDGTSTEGIQQNTLVESASVRNMPIVPIVEEKADESHPETTSAVVVEEQEQRKALEAVQALSSLFEFPSPSKDYTMSPVSVRDLWEDHTRCTAANKAASETKDSSSVPSTTQQQEPRRSIFGARSSNNAESSSPSVSAFGVYALEDRSSAAMPETQDVPEREFRMLGQGDRANSLPSPLPRKSSLKRFPSMQSACTVESSAAPSKVVKRSVSFGKLETREYSIALSDHPSCSYGPPISLGWDFRDKEAVELEQYEERRLPRRSMHQMLLSYNVRRYLLLKRAGYTHNELEEAMNEVDRVKRQRLVTDLLLPASKIDETFEDVMGHVKRMFGGGN